MTVLIDITDNEWEYLNKLVKNGDVLGHYERLIVNGTPFVQKERSNDLENAIEMLGILKAQAKNSGENTFVWDVRQDSFNFAIDKSIEVLKKEAFFLQAAKDKQCFECKNVEECIETRLRATTKALKLISEENFQIEELIDDVERLTWYSNVNGKLVEGATSKTGFYKASDIEEVLEKYRGK